MELKLGQLRQVLEKASIQEEDIQTVILALGLLAGNKLEGAGQIWSERASKIIDPH